MIERRTYAKPLYPGSFLPEEGASEQVPNYMTAEHIALAFSDKPGWFAIEVTNQNWKFWETEEGDREWRPAKDDTAKSYRIYIGELMTSAEVAALDGDHEILLSNMRINDWDPIVRTRRGNFQPLEEGDVVLAPAGVAA